MVLSRLEDLFFASDKPFDKEEDGVLVIADGDGIEEPLYIFFTEDGRDWIKAHCLFDSVGTKEIPRFEDLSLVIAHNLRFRGFVDFNEQGFYAYTFMRPDSAQYEIEDFIWVCRRLIPLLVQVSTSGNWNHDLVNLALGHTTAQA